MSTSRRMRVALLAAGFAIALGPVSAQAADTIKIGVDEPLTGAVAASGNWVTQGAKMAADDINAKGGVLGRKLELVIEDNKSNPTEAVAAAEKLIVRDKVPVLMGAWSSTYTLAVMPKLMEYKVPMVVETSSSDKITTSGNPYIFRTAATNGMEAKAFAKYVHKLGIKKADFLVVNNDWGLGAAQAFSAMLKSQGVKIGIEQTMDASTQDLSAQLSKIKASDADTLFVTTGVEQITLILKQAQSLGLKKRMIATGGDSSPAQLIQQVGDGANGTYHILFFAPWFPQKAENPKVAEAFVNEWKKRGYDFAGLPDGFRGHDAIATIAAAIKLAGKAEPEAIRKALWEVHVKGINGNISFVKEGPKGKESG
ncbi:MAG TPA: ABC transporter substrate-binding protein, partial [Alphaproteobacteria bacterium]|nr:ABC transporter substrate-binding protein [Alphaproteobacteria bacterium]